MVEQGLYMPFVAGSSPVPPTITRREKMETKIWLAWDKNDLVDDWVKRELEDQEAHPELRDEIKTEEQIREDTWDDPDFFDMAYEGMLGILTEWMDGHTSWRTDVENLGWQKRSGYLEFDLQEPSGQQLLWKVLPDTECTYKIWKTEEGLRIQNWHHDSPGGDETYSVRKVM